jgi:hypothetical protein
LRYGSHASGRRVAAVSVRAVIRRHRPSGSQISVIHHRLRERAMFGPSLPFRVRIGTGRERQERPFPKQAANATVRARNRLTNFRPAVSLRQRLGIFQVQRVETFGEQVLDRHEEICRAALLIQHALAGYRQEAALHQLNRTRSRSIFRCAIETI